jgi:hypothetical protein
VGGKDEEGIEDSQHDEMWYWYQQHANEKDFFD